MNCRGRVSNRSGIVNTRDNCGPRIRCSRRGLSVTERAPLTKWECLAGARVAHLVPSTVAEAGDAAADLVSDARAAAEVQRIAISPSCTSVEGVTPNCVFAGRAPVFAGRVPAVIVIAQFKVGVVSGCYCVRESLLPDDDYVYTIELSECPWA